jgi:hypothetical protein
MKSMEVSDMAWYILFFIGWLYIILKLPGADAHGDPYIEFVFEYFT